jgi:hypothetical protein
MNCWKSFAKKKSSYYYKMSWSQMMNSAMFYWVSWTIDKKIAIDLESTLAVTSLVWMQHLFVSTFCIAVFDYKWIVENHFLWENGQKQMQNYVEIVLLDVWILPNIYKWVVSLWNCDLVWNRYIWSY